MSSLHCSNDIDFFKNVNDTYGHAGGDEILKSFAALLNTEISEPNQVGRIGGEEFLAIIYNSSINYLHDLCEKIRQVVEKETTLFDNQKIKVQSSEEKK